MSTLSSDDIAAVLDSLPKAMICECSRGGAHVVYEPEGSARVVAVVESIVAARVEAALAEAADGLETHMVNVECAGCGSPNWAPMSYAARLINPRSTNQEADDAL